MKLSGNTVLITGGTSGIGYELAIQFLQRGNTVIVTGRDMSRLEQTQRRLPGIHIYQSDVRDPQEIASLFDSAIQNFPGLNVLINNAGIMRKIALLNQGQSLGDINGEIDTNLTGMVRIVTQFLPHLKTQHDPVIVNVSSGLAFVPLPIAPIYCAAKAGVHSFTQSLRVQLKNTKIKVFELAPPMTRTGLFSGQIRPEDVQGIPMMDVRKMVREAMRGLEKDHLEIRPGLSNVLKLLSRVAPHLALRRLSKTAVAIEVRAT